MKLTVAQIKGKIKSLASKNNADARLLLRIYMMDRFLDRLSYSKYRDNFIIKGGILVTSMVGVAMRSTMDIDTSIKNLNLSEEDALIIIKEISEISLDDGVVFEIMKVEKIMDDFEYPGIRIELNAIIDRMITPIKIDISTGDIITPREIEYSHNLLLEDRAIKIWAYNLETVLAEKLQTILVRHIFNTRMRDFYDVYALTNLYEDSINYQVLHDAFVATSQKRNSQFENTEEIIQMVASDGGIQNLWKSYQKKYIYASEISFDEVIKTVRILIQKVGK
ncbi:MAG: nucleotidyl transferase AbiEii/AbiGii toxin family protein [Firmicutes bacterium]|nr:nucleotidyl transferase AbiEii/AbiGii toxin family protein [Bacillota bacterium]